MARYFLFLSYDGTAYHGWQAQPNAVGVQQRLDEALAALLRAPVATVGAGRTDAGVHARRMAVHFDTDRFDDLLDPASSAGLESALDRLADRLNRLLPPDMSVGGIRRVSPAAHARFSALFRTYHYRVHTRKDPFLRHYSLRLYAVPDFAAMNAAAALLLDVSDFTSFSKLHTDANTNLCRVTRAEWVREEADRWRFEITADRFLRNMVRAVVGTLLEVGRGRMTREEFAAVVARRSRQAAGESVPGHALSLVEVGYPPDIFI